MTQTPDLALPIADDKSDITMLGCRIVHDGFRRYAIYRFTDEGAGLPAPPQRHAPAEPVEREMLVTHRTVAVLPVDTASGDLVLLRQFRLGAHLATGKGLMIEIVAGAVDEGETADGAARRELKEEAGLDALSLHQALTFMPSPGMTNEHVTLFIAAVDADDLPAHAGTGTDEPIWPFRCSFTDAETAADQGLMANGFILLALNWYARHRNALGQQGDVSP